MIKPSSGGNGNCVKCVKYVIAYPSHLVCTFIRYITAIVLHWVYTHCVLRIYEFHAYIHLPWSAWICLKGGFFLVLPTPEGYGPMQRSNKRVESKLRLQGKLNWLVGRPGLELTFRSINVCRRRSTRLKSQDSSEKTLYTSE